MKAECLVIIEHPVTVPEISTRTFYFAKQHVRFKLQLLFAVTGWLM